MPFKCSAFGCTSGYDSDPGPAPGSQKITYHSVPCNDEKLLAKWIRANPRQNWQPTKNSKICSLHFDSGDFEDARTDSNVSRRKKKETVSEKPTLRRLKKGVVPSIFPNAPTYLSNPKPSPRETSLATANSRYEHETQRLDKLEALFHANDDVAGASLLEVAEKLKQEATMPDGSLISVLDGAVVVYSLEVQEGQAKMTASITVSSDMTTIVSLDDNVIPAEQYEDLVNERVTKISQLVNLVARVKSWLADSSPRPWQLCAKMAVSLLEDGLENLKMNEPDSNEQCQLDFIIQQLKLMTKSRYHRHYSPSVNNISIHHSRRQRGNARHSSRLKYSVSSFDKYAEKNHQTRG